MNEPRLHLDPTEAAQHKQQRHWRFNVVQLPLIRFGGYSLVLLLMWLNVFFHPSSPVAFGPLCAALYGYCALSWACLYLGFERWPSLDMVFLSTDVACYAALVYLSGAEQSWLYVLMVVRTADQVSSTFKRAIYFAHLNTFCYLIMLLWAHHVEGPDFSTSSAEMRLATIYLVNLYLMMTARTAGNLRHQTTEAVRVARAMIERQQHTQRELERVSHYQERLLNAAPDGIYTLDDHGCCVTVNPAGLRLLGYEPGEVIGQDMHALLHPRHEDGSAYAAADCPISECLRLGTTLAEKEEIFWRKDGTSMPVEVSCSPLQDGTEQIGVVVIFRDITQRRELARMKDEFLAIVSHELRTPLSALRGSLGLLASGTLGKLEPKGARMLDVALGSSQRLIRLVNDILDMERMAGGHLNLVRVPTPVTSFVESAAAEVLPQASGAGIRIETTSVDGLANVDTDRMVQALVNLLSNAIKFSPRDSLVRISVERRDAEFLFGVHDQGRGIPSAQLTAIFERFYQVDASDARQQGGAGLGAGHHARHCRGARRPHLG
jgi:PAS domain S-box-containing protein